MTDTEVLVIVTKIVWTLERLLPPLIILFALCLLLLIGIAADALIEALRRSRRRCNRKR